MFIAIGTIESFFLFFSPALSLFPMNHWPQYLRLFQAAERVGLKNKKSI